MDMVCKNKNIGRKFGDTVPLRKHQKSGTLSKIGKSENKEVKCQPKFCFLQPNSLRLRGTVLPRVSLAERK